jgi:taurine dioxygenase
MAEAALDLSKPAAYERIGVKRIAGALGAEIEGVDLSKPLDDGTFAELHRAWLENQVIVLRGQDITPDQHVAFAKRWGKIHHHPFNKPMEGYPDIIDIVKTEDATFNHGGRWHSDQMYTAQPAKATMLVAREMPPYGGDTMFSNLYLAYETLSDGMKETIANLKGVNNGDSTKHSSGMTRAERAKAGIGQMAQIDPPDIKVQTISTHPIVRTHPETKRKALYLGSHTERFHGMTDAESEPLLHYLQDHAHRPEFTMRLRWEVGTVTMWDNRCCQHYALNDYHGFRRRMHKITICGDTPF